MDIMKKERVNLTPVCGEISSLLAPEARIDLKLESVSDTGIIRGMVTDYSENPIPGAMVQLAKNRFEPIEDCLTQIDGTFVFSGIPAKTRYWLYAGGEGYIVSDTLPFFLAPNQEISHHIRLHPQRKEELKCIAGKVTQSDGLPAAISVVLTFRLENEVMHYHELSLCDAFGRYMVTELRPGRYLLRLITEDHLPQVVRMRIGHQDSLIQQDFVLSDP